MRCMNCGQDNSDDSIFCSGCGLKLDVRQMNSQNTQNEEILTQNVDNGAEPVINSENTAEPVIDSENTAEPVIDTGNTAEPVQNGKVETVSMQNAENALFGTSQTQQNLDPQTIRPQRADNKLSFLKKIPKKVYICAAAGAAVIIAAIILIIVLRPAKFSKQEDFIIALTEEETQFILSDRIIGKCDEKCDITDRSIDGKSAIAAADEYLFFVNEKGVREICDDYNSGIISDDGTGILYYSEEDTLILVDSENDSRKELVDEISNSLYFVLSPDGDTALYSYRNEDDEHELYVYNKGESKRLGKNLTPIAVSDSAKYIYAFNPGKNALYILDINENKEKIAGDITSGSVVFNSDRDQIMFSSDYMCYISIKGGEKIKTNSSNSLWPLCPDSVAVKADETYSFTTYTYMLDNLLDNVYQGDSDRIIYIDAKGETTKIVSADNARIADDGKTVYFIKNDNLYSMNIFNQDTLMKLAEDVDGYCITANGKCAYVVNDDEELWYIKDENNKKKLADDVNMIRITDKDVLLIMADYSKGAGTLYYCRNGSDKKKISEYVEGVEVVAGAAYYYIEVNSNERSLYGGNGDGSFKLIYKGY